MAKTIPIIIGSSVAIIIAMVSVMTYNVPSDEKSALEIKDSASIQPIASDVLPATDSVTISKSTVDFYINEGGNKTYVLNVTDSPTIEE